ncbi:hypothetical protein J6590_023273 [Homalodisca vitripennis]|nr:hypothetical protein J6590_023273 [Homalodisca vitripennis]
MEVGDAEDFIEESLNPRKRQSYGWLRDATKRLRAQSFELGENCFCKSFRCFEVIPVNEKKRILGNFNEIGATSREPWNAQSSYLAGLISVLPVNRRRSREADQAAARTHDCTFGYRVVLLAVVSTGVQMYSGGNNRAVVEQSAGDRSSCSA